jgi:hypothetical protein
MCKEIGEKLIYALTRALVKIGIPAVEKLIEAL